MNRDNAIEGRTLWPARVPLDPLLARKASRRGRGLLEHGKVADFAIHDCDDYRELPYFFGRDTAHAVYRDGKCVYRRGA